MTEERPASFQAARDLRTLLRELGQVEPAARPADAENAREERMAARMDAELESLVEARRSSRKVVAFSLVAAAALGLLTLGLRHLGPGPSSLAIAREPIAPRAPKSERKVETPSAVPASRLAVPPPTPRASLPSAAAVVPSAEPVSTLAEENQLFKASAEASRNGDVAGALSQLDRLLSLHPQSPLAQTAQVRKFRLLTKAGRVDDARREARRYLASYPTGFAVAEAQTLLAGGAVSEPAAPVQEPSAP